MFNIYTYLYYVNIKPIDTKTMENLSFLFAIQLLYFCIIFSFIAKFFINLLIDKQ